MGGQADKCRSSVFSSIWRIALPALGNETGNETGDKTDGEIVDQIGD